jgi:hypothetical protein
MKFPLQKIDAGVIAFGNGKDVQVHGVSANWCICRGRIEDVCSISGLI